eukprot:TRINITY_DN11156_c0_g1_i1.p1 TRINITY_DN11156_c0_g1~~TRINITY_DN11156_c0_g1_i1.p1  ORF type:complete len:232 (+),score=40.08 TRINITY_DN11156_c0_g1_i1:3-698(+)
MSVDLPHAPGSSDPVPPPSRSAFPAPGERDSSIAPANQQQVVPVYRRPHPSGIVPVIHNVVCTVDLSIPVELDTIALRVQNTKYDPTRFAAATMRISSPKSTALVFKKGNLVCTGAKSEELAKEASHKFVALIQNIGYDVKFTDFKIVNMVAHFDIRFPVRLEDFALDHSQFCSYEPETFPGLIYRMANPSVTILIFSSGKVILSNVKTRGQLHDAFDNIYPVLKAHRNTS